jgi:hypothetical protein
MTKLLLLLTCWLIAWGTTSQTPPATFPDLATITKKSVGKAQVGMPVAKLKEAYKGYAFSPTDLVKYGFDEYVGKPNATLITRNGQKLLVFWVNTQTNKVAGLIALHPAYQTAQGIHVGSTSGQLKAVFPTTQVVPNMMMQEIQMAFVGPVDKPGIEYAFLKQVPVGKYLVADEPVRITNPSARITWIQVFPNP